MGNKEKVKEIFNKVKAENRSYVLEHEAKEALSLYGINVTKETVCKTSEEAVKAGEKIGFPVVLKVVSPDVVHKTDSGGVIVGVKSEQELEKGFNQIIENQKKFNPKAIIKGISVQEMAKGEEIIIGSVKDPQFGPMVMLGIGGIFVEIFKDVSYRLIPIEKIDAEEMLSELKGYPLLCGARGREKTNLESIKETLQNVSKFLLDFDEVKEMDLNPIFVNKERATVADARIFI
ncbi:MAG: acetyl-CoA synthetase [Candidatus Schekmanbacteria bacterium RIFCSPHIGHO2_02_FULL_38_11]|uniref:Acetyl-CoA synthetase n=1 Tax=Candidatus Schekmanbacteria bacterium RIFCSPLOWO2_12_FULL_38_15 TaxID=1817883 RepID=A0A1F7SIS4_9BACT|nr:MAG: acetyl-CoA synthetase [Candidatus Schekmanbacteria bacterium RIFCSPLOWO2_02_FULL_38_14]OGL53114.1 MAG: acetyl-CoA synthetase [Candidatus Schekmanbacteria bacterium RIFCSPLOWO2_12_FULL_38_15]OGL53799.1 MAG: acetyl-CoA synthetase [Candidatus Schekmanbacteria bacterium RIFCSPHIGHO2_02_FULL_38_11]